MAKQNVEDIKLNSRGLRGDIPEVLSSPEATHFDEAGYQLLKFHGTYQQDDRDVRNQRKKEKLDKAWMFMIRSKMPGGKLTAQQYILHDEVAGEQGNGTLRLTTRQGIQFHGVLKSGLKETIAAVKNCGLTTWGACGDVVRNTMGPGSALKDPIHEDCQKLADEISTTFLPTSSSYVQIWLNGEKHEIAEDPAEQPEDPIYGKVYLPRKFKIGIAVPPRNDVDILTQDLAFVPHATADGLAVEGYTVYVGGGLGMTHNMTKTHPRLAEPMFFVPREHVLEAAIAVVTTQRDYGNREDRKRARLKYLIEERGLAWFRQEVESRMKGSTEEPRLAEFTTVGDMLGWHEQGDGNFFCGVHVAGGRITDGNIVEGRADKNEANGSSEGSPRYRSAFRRIAEEIGCNFIITPNTNLVLSDIRPADKERVQAMLDEHGIPSADGYTEMRKTAHACVALPTCGLAMSESERALPDLLDRFDSVLYKLGLESEPLLFRMTGCPNGCARPYNADFSLVGRAPGKYAVYVGGSSRGDKLGGLFEKTLPVEEVPVKFEELLTEFKAERLDGERFTDWWHRTHENGAAPDPDHFHVELKERDARLAEARANGEKPEMSAV